MGLFFLGPKAVEKRRAEATPKPRGTKFKNNTTSPSTNSETEPNPIKTIHLIQTCFNYKNKKIHYTHARYTHPNFE